LNRIAPLLAIVLAACPSPARNGASQPDDRAEDRGNQTMSDRDRYSWGEPACGGIAVGVGVETKRVVAGKPFAVSLAFANRSAEEKDLVLFYDLDGKYRSRLVATHAKSGKESVRGALGTKIPTTSGYKIQIKLAPGEIHERAADPVTFAGEPDLLGPASLRFHYGGNEGMPCEVVSTPVELEIVAE
jgi:hypothetical protein